MSTKTQNSNAPKDDTAVYSDEAWEQLEKKREQMKQSRITQLFDQLSIKLSEAKTLDRQIRVAIGDEEKANQQIVLLAVKAAGDNGVALGELRRLIPEPNQLNDAREKLLHPEDEVGKELPPLIKEKRGENNELRIYAVEQEEEKAE